MWCSMTVAVLIVCAVAMVVSFRSAVVAEKRHEPKPEHVERRNECGDYPNQPEHPASMSARVCLPQNLVFAEEARQRPETRDRKSCDRHREERPRNVLTQAAHLAHVLFAADRMDDRPGCQEQQAFKKRMRHQV